MSSDAASLLATVQTWDLPLPERQLKRVWSVITPSYNEIALGASTRLEYVCGALSELRAYDPDQTLVLACLLQFLPDLPPKQAVALAEFGSDVAALAQSIHRLRLVQADGQRISVEHLRASYFNLSADPRAILATLCEKLWLLKNISFLPVRRQAAFAREVLKVYSPVASRLGIYGLKHALEGLAFPIAYPTDSERIQQQLGDIHKRYGLFLKTVAAELTNALSKQGIAVRIEAREKQPYSIFAKMREKGLSDIEDLFDLFALRIIVPEVGDCYQVLGQLHQLGHSLPNRFKDYITLPKPNGYQSLHTALTHLPGVPEGVLVEVQIRTAAMHREAELGIAAHWNYKEGSRTLDRLTRRVRPAAEGDDGGEADDEPLDRIFVLTPRGDVVELPAGATPLDFAFSVHTALGLSYKGSKVNGAIVPMEHPLENGDVVEIIRSAEPHPSVRWMPLLKTAAARARLRKALAERHREAYIDRGRQALNQALKTRRLPALDTDLSVLASLGGEPADMQRRSDFLARLGQGTLKLAAALGTIDAVSSRLAQKSKAAPAAVADGWNVVLEADVHLSHRFARCCKPDTGKREAVVGVVSRQRVVIHRQKCKALKTVAAERRIPAEWVAPIVSVSRGKKR